MSSFKSARSWTRESSKRLAVAPMPDVVRSTDGSERHLRAFVTSDGDAPAVDPVESVPGQALKERANSKNKGNFKNALRGRLSRYFHLPAFRDVPNLLVDFDQVTSLPYDEVNNLEWERVATIDSPFCEALLQHFGHGAARIGVEDLPVDHLVDTAFEEALKAAAANK